MTNSMDRSVRNTRFAIADLQKRIAVLQDTRDDLSRQMSKLVASVPENEIDPTAEREGYVAYGSYAQSVIARKENLRATLTDIEAQASGLGDELRMALDALDSFERVRARQMADKAEQALKRA
ncbi:hypothetical protein, partial [Robiginitomaculum antarcticum]|uniref:hypothetical protein n=1 Tax=Robiginitomaculum antarcticum TaxID=437507 RepID=UPI00036FF611